DQWVKLSLIIEPGIATVYIGFGLSGAAVEYVYYDNATVREANPLDGVITSATVGQPGQGNIPLVYDFDGLNDFVDIYDADLETIMDKSTGTLLAFCSVTDWTDGIFRRVGNLRTDVSNQVLFQKEDVNNRFSMQYIAGGVAENIQVNGLTFTGLFMPAITWDTAADEVKAYINAVQQSTTRTGLGVWAGALAATDCVIGARTTAPNLLWDGGIAFFALFDEVLQSSELGTILTASGI
ncbi:MAG: hypothetical protein ACYTBJ_25265, partial [Planctomycetota bacterium]